MRFVLVTHKIFLIFFHLRRVLSIFFHNIQIHIQTSHIIFLLYFFIIIPYDRRKVNSFFRRTTSKSKYNKSKKAVVGIKVSIIFDESQSLLSYSTLMLHSCFPCSVLPSAFAFLQVYYITAFQLCQ